MALSPSPTCSQKEQKERFLRRPAEGRRLCTEPLLGPAGWPSEEEGEEGDAAARMLLRFREQRCPADAAAAAGARPATCAKLYNNACACRSQGMGSEPNVH